MRELAGRVAVVTGAAQGIGRALATRLIAEQMKVVVADIDAPRLADVGAELRSRGEVEIVACDVSIADDVERLAQRALDRFGGVHVLCNNAGVLGRADAWTGPIADWKQVLDINLGGVLLGVRAFLPILRNAGEGHIVNTASMAGLTALPGAVAYGVSKHGVVALSEALYLELRMSGSPIGVSCLCPGFVRTQLVSREHDDESATHSEVSRMIFDQMRSGVDAGIAPSQVADEVVEAIRADRFWILTHRDQRRAPTARMRRAARQENPPLGPESRHPELARVLRKLRSQGRSMTSLNSMWRSTRGRGG